MEDFEETKPFEVHLPGAQRVPFVFNSPHSGAAYPNAFLAASRLTAPRIRASEDAFVDELFGSVTAFGAPLLRAHFPRVYLDVNREPYELDPGMFTGSLPPFVNSRSVRVASGLGTVARVVGEREEIYKKALEPQEALERIETLYKPYHAELRHLLARTHAAFGYAILIDCHSMPSTARGQDRWRRPDFIVGDRHGTSCSTRLTDAACAILSDLGYNVARNKPYAGGFITEHYGRPSKGLHSLQIEINRALYMDELRITKHVGFRRLAGDLVHFVQQLIAIESGSFGAVADAAE
ncbi:MAG: N-formylglutamate amidohydrolase [Hyphomicrobiales bacterium]|nr:MAG: N-formylglutamate amidohydrolase [Hyphomicrobiales bacterium]